MAQADINFVHHYLVALGSNLRHHRHGLPPSILQSVMARLDEEPTRIVARAPLMQSRPIGPSLRIYANGAVTVASDLPPDAMLRHLKAIERKYGMRHRRRWSSRVLDLDIILWRCAAGDNASIWSSSQLSIPHTHFRERDFVLQPAKAIAGDWRDPVTGFTVSQLYHRFKKPVPKP